MDFLRKYNWLFPVLVLFSLGLGTIGFAQYYSGTGQHSTFFSNVYLSLQLFVLNSGGLLEHVPPLLDIARFLAPAVTASGIFLAIWEPFYKNYQLYQIRFYKDHIVVCGLSKKAELLIHDFIKTGNTTTRIILIEPNETHASLSAMKNKGVILLQGNATDEEMLMKANIFTAKYLLALTHDEKTNIHIAQKATRLFNHHPGKIPANHSMQAILHIDDFYTMNIFKEFHEKAVPDLPLHKTSGTKLDYHVFSIYQLAAAYMVDHFSPDQYVSLSNDEDPAAHVLILGDNLAAQYLILEAAEMYHFANLKKTKITVVADNVIPLNQKIEALYPFLDNTVHLRYVTTETFFGEQNPVSCDDLSVCFVALDDDGQSVYFSRKLRQYIHMHGSQSRQHNEASFSKYANLSDAAPPIIALLPRNTALVNIFNDVTTEMHALNIDLLNLDEEICNKKTIVDNRKTEDFIAKHIHYDWLHAQAKKTNMVLGSMDQEWDKLKDAQKDSNRLPARHLNIKLRYVNAEITDRAGGEELDFDQLGDKMWDRIARLEHNRWNAEKFIKGFIKIDGIHDRSLSRFMNRHLKCHTDLVSFDELSPEVQSYDTFTFRMAPTIARLNNKRILKKEKMPTPDSQP